MFKYSDFKCKYILTQYIFQTQAKQLQLQQLNHQWKMLESKKRALAGFPRPGVGGVRGRSASHENVAMTQAQEMMMRHSLNDGTPGHTNIDPFLAGDNRYPSMQRTP